ncbi:hypothetical protein CAFEA_08110 [Corynebacterium afermentans subsp. afermentans]|uniref:Uncharacterized protein n=2 Tax=Corynebacterium afermentans TaxID=38286 RepID=A0A9X8R605_9CORY|nr:hypothetical protein CAFEA_08110 [Corynebacterium afermentans subsp. afermentans]SIQ58021.1 hypothetical protein SAMN05421802_11939 [Corynebacterium afermentans]
MTVSEYSELLSAGNDFGRRNDGVRSSSRKSARVSKMLYESKHKPLSFRMLVQQALREGTPHRFRFITDVFCKADIAWAALPFARAGITDSKSQWQIRRAKEVEGKSRPPETVIGPKTVEVTCHTHSCTVKVHARGAASYDKVLDVSFDNLSPQLYSILDGEPFKFLNDTVIFDVASACEEFLSILEGLGRNELLPVDLYCVGPLHQIAGLMGRDRQHPSTIHFIAREAENVVYLGADSGQADSGVTVALRKSMQLSEVIDLIRLQKVEQILSIVRGASTKKQVVEQLQREIDPFRNPLTVDSDHDFSSTLLPFVKEKGN